VVKNVSDCKPEFRGLVKTEWMPKRRMLLLSAVMFTDKNCITWIAKQGSIIDGASIPKLFWRIIGSPFVGQFRRASVIHDVYCESKSRPHKDVHQVFYEMMLCDNVPLWKSKFMYWAVKSFGPKWENC